MATLRPIKLMFLGLVVGFGLACAEDDGDDGLISGVTNVRIADACSNYCDQAKTCNDDVDVEDCRSDCEDNMQDCMADEQEEAVEDVESCSMEACNEFVGCTIGAGLQCSFGV